MFGKEVNTEPQLCKLSSDAFEYKSRYDNSYTIDTGEETPCYLILTKVGSGKIYRIEATYEEREMALDSRDRRNDIYPEPESEVFFLESGECPKVNRAIEAKKFERLDGEFVE